MLRKPFFSWAQGSSSKIVRQYEEKYNRIGKVLDDNPELLNFADKDLKKLSRPGGSRRGRKATYTSENLFRAIIVHQIEGTALRRTMVLIAHSEFLKSFLRLGNRSAMDYTLLDKAFKAIQPETWEKINAALTQCALNEGRIDPKTLRVDTTVVEATIHWPTDSSLLWDSYRVLYRLLNEGRKLAPGEIDGRFHEKKVKKLHLFITRYASSKDKKRQRKVKSCQKKLIQQVERIHEVAAEFALSVKDSPDFSLWAAGVAIKEYLPKVRKTITQATRRWIDGETVPAKDRIFSIFEEHVELIKRGRRHKPVEFGHMILLGQTKDKFITQYDVMEEKVHDKYLPEQILARHEESFGEFPHTLIERPSIRFRNQPNLVIRFLQRPPHCGRTHTSRERCRTCAGAGYGLENFVTN